MNFIDFIINNWKLILLAVVVILEIICCCLKGKTKTVYFSLIGDLCQYIREAESMDFQNGEGKLLYVMQRFEEAHPEVDVPAWYIKNQVERILSTPTKKGGSGREKD